MTDKTVEQIKELAEEIRIAERTLAELGQQRRAAVGRLRDEGWSYQQIADALGVTRSRAQQLSKEPIRLVSAPSLARTRKPRCRLDGG